MTHPVFQVAYPKTIDGVILRFLIQEKPGQTKPLMIKLLKKLGEMFIKNFKQYAEDQRIRFYRVRPEI
ncbi:hypothetical protein [Leptospira noguchii]|uniref:hypothetical protein n=1 Tax=Leptospira noguchii TaxID=28182 RepID=UPI001FB67F49|nr:hypothetical protein [Leptospira noguchii]UOG62643.1 hypothetical protein MAL07_19715 [Leptospira noguchii]